MTFLDDLLSTLSSGIPFLAISTREPERLEALLATEAGSAGRVFERVAPAAPDDDANHRALHTWLDHVSQVPDGAWVSLPDGLRHLTSPGTRRRLLDLEPVLLRRGIVLFFPAQFEGVPDELTGRVPCLDFPLPDEALRRELLAACPGPGDAPWEPEVVEVLAGLLAGLTAAEVARLATRVARTAGPREVLLAEARRLKAELVRRTRSLEVRYPGETLDDVGGLDLLKGWLVRRKRAFLPEARAFGLPEPRGLFLFGVQGCGKSLAAKVLSSVFELPLLRLDFVALFGSDTSPEAGLHDVLATCDAMAPVVLWIDEIDKLFASTGGGDGASLARVFAGFLTWMQERRSPVFVVATANAVDRLPPELLRKGRFDDIFFLDLPGVFEREEILRIHLRRRGRDPLGFDVTALARRAGFFSGAELEQVVIGGLYRAFEAGRDLVQDDLDAEVTATIPLYATAEETVKGLREFARTRARPATSATDVLDLFRRKK